MIIFNLQRSLLLHRPDYQGSPETSKTKINKEKCLHFYEAENVTVKWKP